ncbi:NtaA/DmoA family FMN-dependent monooxygenase [Streptomyces sp. NPDC006638]|uniref:NtaA/DmoA family FMN-dependent monooxygenase n=1 Tax=Streptomyces sp. NPDC006638 TaxID=3157183 RepID=UPI0033B76175
MTAGRSTTDRGTSGRGASGREGDGRRTLHLAARFPGADSTTVRAGSRTGSPIEFSSFERLARTAERGLFDFLLLADEPRPYEQQGPVPDPDLVGRPESITVLNALAAVTDRLGLAATANAAFCEPFELARRLATLDRLSEGRAAWHVVTSCDAVTGQNFRRGGYLDRADRHTRAAEFVATARELWDSWTPAAPGAPYGVPRPFAHTGRHFAIEGEFTVPRSPQGHPVVIQAGDSEEGRESAASAADVVLGRHTTPEAGRAFYADVKARLARYGRRPGDLKIMPGVTYVLGDTDAEAQERAAGIRRQQVSPRDALLALERVWGRDLSAYDPDGPLPDADPDPAAVTGRGGTADGGPLAVAARWRALSEAKGLSIRDTVVETTARQSFIGTPLTVAEALDTLVRQEAADGFLLVPPPVPGGLDDFVDRVVPLLQERGVFRTEYAGTTLRSHLGLPDPVWKG